MGTHKNKSYPLRVSEELMNELTIIAENENRTRNKHIEYILKKHVEEYKTEHQKKQERAEVKEKLSQSKIG